MAGTAKVGLPRAPHRWTSFCSLVARRGAARGRVPSVLGARVGGAAVEGRNGVSEVVSPECGTCDSAEGTLIGLDVGFRGVEFCEVLIWRRKGS